MAKVVVGAEVKVEKGQAGKDIGDLKKQFTDAKDEAVKIGKAFGENSKEFEKAKEKLVDVTTQFKSFAATAGTLKQAKLQLQGIVEVFGATSQEAVAAAKYVAQLKDQIGDAKELVNSFNPDAKFAAFSGAIQGVVSGFSALQGAQALFGAESKELEKTLVKVQAAMALSQGINGIFAAKDAFVNLIAVVKNSNVFMKIFAASTALTTTIMEAFGVAVTGTSVAFRVLRTAIIATGIGALVVGLGLLVEKIIEWTSSTDAQVLSQEDLAQATRDTTEALNKYYDAIDRANKIEVLRARIAGASQAQIDAIEDSATKKKIAQIDGFIKLAKEYNIATVNLEQERQKLLEQLEVETLTRRATNAEAQRKEDAKRLAEYKELLKKLKEESRKARAQEEKDIQDFGQRLRDEDNRQAKLKIENDKANKEYELQQKALLAEQDLLNNPDSPEAKKAKIAADLEIELQGLEDNMLAQQNARLRAQAEYTKIDEEGKEARVAIAKAERDAKLETYTAVANATDVLADIIGKNTAAGKVLSIAAATINTYVGATKALEQGGVLGIASAAAVILSGLNSVRKIIATKIPGQNERSSSVPNISQQSPILPGTTNTTLDANSINAVGNAAAARVFVLETDVTNNQERIRRLNRAARIN